MDTIVHLYLPFSLSQPQAGFMADMPATGKQIP